MSGPEASNAVEFVRRLGRFRRRLVALRVRERLVPASAAALVVWAVALLALRPDGWVAVRWLGAAAAAGVAAAVVVTLAERLSLLRAAEELDRRFRLADRLTTAIGCAEQDDEVSRLVVADAAAHLVRLHPADLTARSRTKPGWLLGSGLAAALAGLTVLGSPDTHIDGDTASGGAATVAAATEAGEPSGLARARTATATDASAAAGARRIDPSADDRRVVERDRLLGESGAPGASAPGTASPARSNGSPGAAGAATGAGDGGSVGTDATRADTAGAGSPQTSGLGRATRDGDAGASRGGGAGDSRGDTAGAAGAGGVTAARAGRGTQSGRSDAPSGRSVAGERLRAIRAAESPVAQERVPVRRRDYVRNYFETMRRTGAAGDAR